MISFLVYSFLLLTVFSQGGSSIECVSCSWSISSPMDSPNCYDFANPNDPTTPVLDCSAFRDAYCQTEFDLVDGILSAVIRRCTGPSFDQVTSLDVMPMNENCLATYNLKGTNVEVTNCYLACNETDACNNQTAADLHQCPNDCGPNGQCNYITGKCACKNGFSGETCTIGNPPKPAFYMSCVQCDSESDPSCLTSTTPSVCPNADQKYCSVSSVSTFDEDGKKVRSFISRSCTEEYVATDQCFISDSEYIAENLIEYTCVSTCDTNGCNTAAPDEVDIGRSEVQPILCVVCDISDGLNNCAEKTTTDVCPSDSTHCLSTVSYYISDKADLSDEEAEENYRIKSIDRRCTNKTVEKGCMEISLGVSSLKMVTCQETCTGKGCNTGWPARPKCSQCSCGDQCSSTDRTCFFNPPSPSPCSLPYDNYCVIEDLNRDIQGVERDAVNGYSRTITRRCSHYDVGNLCQVSEYSSDIENCYKTCQENGCNLGFSAYAVIEPPSSAVALVSTTTDAGSSLQPGALFIYMTLLIFSVIFL